MSGETYGISGDVLRMMAERLERDIDALTASSLCGTQTATTESAPLDVDKMLRDMQKLMAQSRRTDVTITASLGHVGPITMERRPADGTFIECSFRDLQRIHEHSPLFLHEIVDEHTGRFKVATPLHRFIPRYVPLPPYELNRDD